MKGKNYQSGVTILALLITIILLSFVGYLGLKLVPYYYQHYFMVDNLKSALNSQNISVDNFQNFKQNLNKKFEDRLDIDGANSITAEKLILSEEKNNVYVNLSYRVQVHIIGNMDVVLRFNNKLKAKNE